MTAATLSGLVLAGGSSRRMGADKAALEIAGEPLLDRAVRLLADELNTVRVAVRPDQVSDVVRKRHALIEDSFIDIGPAAGILSAHLTDPESAWLVIACDMPKLDRQTIVQLISERDSQVDATAWALPPYNAPEPLCAIYEPVTLAAFLECVENGGNSSPRSWLETVPLKLLEARDPGSLESANTRDQFDSMMGK